MNFLRNRTLAFQLSLLLATLAVLFVAEFLVIRWNFHLLEKMHYQRDLARRTQLAGQQIFFEAALGAQDKAVVSRTIATQLAEQDHAMRILAEGGRIEGTTVLIGQLPYLPRISFDELNERWQIFRQTAERIAAAGASTTLQKDIALARSQWIAINSWYDRLIDDLDLLIADKRFTANVWLMVVALLNIAVSLTWYPVFRKKILDPLKTLESNTAAHRHTLGLEGNELGAAAGQVNNIIEQLKDASDFVKAIGEGKLSLNYEEFDKGYTKGTSRLADSLIDMQSRLRELSEEDQRRQWINEGLTRFVDILRSGTDNLNTLGDKIISTLANYTGSNQGGLYLLNDSDEKNPHLELISLFAYDVKKHESRQIKLGEGILGQTFLEKQTTYLKQLPAEYARITSGLGGANPTSLLVVPLKIDQEVFGVIELASFNAYQEHVITFVERLGETIASTFATVKAAQQNRELLAEARHATEAMRSQEEEMRQNMEELQATQEEMARKERDYIARIEVLEKAPREQTPDAETATLEAELSKLREEKEACEKALDELRNNLNRPAGQEWEVVEGVERALRVNLEAIKAMREGLSS